MAQRLYSHIPFDLSIKELQSRFSDILLEPKYTLKDLDGITYRTINYWDESGFLLRKRRKTERGWRRFSLIELLWVMLLDNLRLLKVNIDSTIPLLFSALDYNQRSGSKSIEAAQVNLIHTILPCLIEKTPLSFFIFFDRVEFKSNDNINTLNSSFENYITISINKLLIDFVSNIKNHKFSNVQFLGTHEADLLDLIVQNHIEELSVLYDNSTTEFKLTEKNKKIDIKKVIELIFKPYTEIAYKTKGGKTVILDRK